MAKCDTGYLCKVCGIQVDQITQSSLYLRYVIGDVPVEALFSSPECHLLCDPDISQFIVAPEFERGDHPPVTNELSLTLEERQRMEDLTTRGWQRLQKVRGLNLPISEYPLDEVRR